MAKSGTVHSLLWVSSESRLVSGWSDGGIRTWSYSGANSYPSWTYQTTLSNDDRVYKMAWLSGSSNLVTTSPDWPHPKLWSGLSSGSFTYLTQDLGAGGHGLCPWSHCDAVTDVAKDSAETRVATSSLDGTLIVWDASTANRQAKLSGHSDHVTSVAWLQSESKIASGSKDYSIKIWDDTGVDQSSSSETLSGHTGQVNALAWDSTVSAGQLASGSSDGYVKLWTCIAR
jgi:WD40 repeat protein